MSETITPRLSRVDSLLQKHGLDFEIQKEQLYSADGRVTPYFGLFNSKVDGIDGCINTCKEGYHVSQNRDVLELVLRGIKNFEDKLTITKAGALHNGRKVFMQLEVEGAAKVGKDILKKYVTIIDSNDGSTGLSVGIGDLTMSCQNQFYKFYKRGNAKFRHTATLEEKIKTIPALIETALNESMLQIKAYQRFQSTPLTKNLADAMVHAVLGYDRIYTPAAILSAKPAKSQNYMNSLYEMMDLEIADKGENLWGAFSGVTRWTTHIKNAPKRENGLEETLMTASSYKAAMKAFDFAVKKSGLKLKDEQLVLS